jgi:hypothetical protein
MVAINNPIDELQRRLETRRKASERITEIVTQGFISQRFGDYAQQLIILDHLADESETYARIGYQEKTMDSLLEMRFQLDNVAGVLMAAGKLETEKVGRGFCVIKNPNLDNMDKYRELFDFARHKYDDALNRCVQILGGVAA